MAGGYKNTIHVVYIYTGLSWKECWSSSWQHQATKEKRRRGWIRNPDLLTDRQTDELFCILIKHTDACESDSFQRESFRKAKGSWRCERKNGAAWNEAASEVFREHEDQRTWRVGFNQRDRRHERERHYGLTSPNNSNYTQPTETRPAILVLIIWYVENHLFPRQWRYERGSPRENIHRNYWD